MKIGQNLAEKQINSKKVFNGELLQVYKDDVELPDGKTSIREWINHPGACAILPVKRDGNVVLISQYRYPVRQIFYEVPAGKIDPGEEPFNTMKRELKEEAGVIAENMEYTGLFYPAIGYANEVIHLFIAWDIEQQQNNVDPDEFVEPWTVSFKECLNMVKRGEITDGKTMACIWKAKFWWEKNKPFSIDFGE